MYILCDCLKLLEYTMGMKLMIFLIISYIQNIKFIVIVHKT